MKGLSRETRKGGFVLDSVKFHSITDRYLDDVYKATLSCCKNRDDVEDAVQNAFLKLLKSDTQFNDDEHIKRWLIRVAVNECKNNWKSFWYRNKVSFDDLDTDPSYRDEIHGELMGTLTKLPQKYQAVIHLYYYEGYNVKEISEILSISESNVQIRLMRARNKLKKLLEEA